MSNSRTLHPEDQIAQYRVVGPLGAGGMGEVYLAQDQSLERSVALKVLPFELTRSDDRVRRFVQEAKSASSLNHPNIVTIYEIGQEPVKSATGGGGDSGPLHYISMELISGKTLGAKIHDERTDLKTLVGYLAQAAEGIAKAHAVGIVHRDLKPGNIMVSDDGFAKVLDFGLAKLTEKSSGPNEATEIADRTSEGAVMGTVSYMSPEQVQGKPVDARADIFSFGCILYEAATRQRPFVADSNVEIMHKILHEKPRPVEELNPHVPAELRRVIRRCLAKQPEQRAQSMKDIAIELREIFDEYDSLHSSATSATTSGSGTSPVLARRKSRTTPVVVGALLVAAVAVGYGLWNARRGGEKTAGQPFETMRLSPVTNRGDVIEAAISPDGRYLAYTAGKSGNVTMRVRQVATGSDVQVLPMQDSQLEFPCFTPDGNYLFYCRRKPDARLYRQLMSVPSLGGQEQERGFDVDSRVAFSPDGKRVAFVRGIPQKNVNAVMVLDLATRKETQLAAIAGPSAPSSAASWSPDGKSIAISVITPRPLAGSIVRIFDAGTGAERDLFKRKGLFLGGVEWFPDGKGLALVGTDITSTITAQVFVLTYPGAEFRRVTNDLNQYDGITVGAGDEAIAAVRSTGLLNLYVCDADDGSSRAITATANPEQSPFTFTTTDDKVYFLAVRGDRASLFSLPVTGGEPVQVATPAGHVIQVHASGGTVLFRLLGADQMPHIWKVDTNGGEAKQLTTGGSENILDISADGTFMTFAREDSSRGVWIASTAGGEAKLFSATALINVGGISWDGKFIATLDLETGPNGMIHNVLTIHSIDGSAPPRLVHFPQTADNFAPSVFDEGVDFIDHADPQWNVYKITPQNDTPVKVSNFTDGRVTELNVSRDGKRVAVVRRLADGANLWVINSDGSQPRQLTHFTGLEIAEIKWMPDSRRVVCMAGQAGRDVVMIRNYR